MLHDDIHDPEDCRALSEVLARIGDRWTILIVGLLGGAGPQRFNEIKRMVEGISPRMLTLTLRALERDGLVVRTSHPTKPPAVEYALTERGRSLWVPLSALAAWGWEQRLDILASRAAFDLASAGQPDKPAPVQIHRIASRAR